ncbi:endothelin-converting enzyme [Tahibacter aquaticus]|uniref:Endothelin-converting enzyme n=1 Tax=Tahibacter aquaticus TaxID=520092 RepID=A0A4R6Z9Q2_9GAMM|nr:M13-type metalloendopeptidase [Tahibacter aquaticus]TDR48454.1 endothelin-converting enzyme [Tahibacter aquaticus]
MNYRLLKPLALAVGIACAGLAMAKVELTRGIDTKQFDTKVKICDDLFGYVNANWLKANAIPGDRSTWGSFEQLDEASIAATHDIAQANAGNLAKLDSKSIEYKIGAFYQSGMDEAAVNKAGVTPIGDWLKRIDGLHTPEEIVTLLHDSHSQGMGLLFNFGGEADFKNSSMVIAYAFQGGLGLPERAYYLEDGKDGSYKKIRDAYVAYVAQVLELTGVDKAAAAKQAQAVLAFEKRLATASLAPVELRTPENQYNFISLETAQKQNPHFGWNKFFASQNLSDSKGFSLSQPKFFAEVDSMLEKVPVADWQAYLRFHMIDGAAPYLNDALAQAHYGFHGKTLRGQQENKPRWKRVMETIDDTMSMALGQLYVAKNFPPEAKQRAQELVDNLRFATKARLEKLDWMSAETKKKALEKWAAFTPKIGYPDEWRKWDGLSIKPDSYFGNVAATAKFNHDWDMSKINKPVDRKEWGMPPQMVNASYNPLQNEITFPAAILQPPFFDPKADDALNYGGIGAVIGHEILHGYDDEGSKFDAKGNLSDWWTKEDREKFEARTDKLVKQFDDYVAIDGLHVKGKLTLGENIADLGGLNVSYDAFKLAQARNNQNPKEKIDGLTPDQRLFINFAQVWRRAFRDAELKRRLNIDPHAPAQFRAIATPSNMPAFAEAFECKSGDRMVRDGDKQVKIW